MSKRQDIVSAAEASFLRDGYATTTMDGLARAANVSKKTLYGHFANKQEIFGEVMQALCHDVGSDFLESAPPFGEPQAVLERIAHEFLARLGDPKIFRLMRLLIAEADAMPELAEVFWNTGPRPTTDYIASYLEELDRQGALAVADPTATAREILSGVMGYDLLPMLLGIAQPPSTEETQQRVRDVIRAVLERHQTSVERTS